jgi:hypothetical protein
MIRHCKLALLLFLISGSLLAAPDAVRHAPTSPSAAAFQVIKVIDAMRVEEHWIAGIHVNWETGLPDGRAETLEGKHTHCSAFVAAAAKRLGVYILRPPEHGQRLLANAQHEWLAREGAREGWVALAGAIDAQSRANAGDLVVAVYRNHDDDRPGHIAIVRPGDRDPEDIDRDGPLITQAGGHNYRSTTLRQGFSGHPAAWERHEVRFYAHAVTRSPS